MKVAVYTIALNEEQFVERWAKSAIDADYLIIGDTGSTDRTVEIATSFTDKEITVVDLRISPWRFDDARNAVLSQVPLDADYCIALDMDEVLVTGWKKSLEEAYASGWTRPRYQYTWSWKPDGTPDLQYGGDKIHARKGYRWKHPVHEVITPYAIEEVQGWVALNIEHHPDNTKSRGQYFPLLKMAIKEDPNDDRNAFYYARELYFHRIYDEAKSEFLRHLSLPSATWAPERAASYRYLAKCDPENAETYLLKAVDEAPSRREALVDLANLYYQKAMWNECYKYSIRALAIKDKPLEYLCEDFAWGYLPYDLAAISAYYLGQKQVAETMNLRAMELNPTEQRLVENHRFYTAT